ncbi:PQQ-binding-like beta-propeller repeat protein [Microbulbifer sp. ANSA003]|uniref:outer membrane protein assembly factor BamB family protein n=1 Tax=unclassified Microbulbifer TaxID=2619833 RepID=UPI004039C8CD
MFIKLSEIKNVRRGCSLVDGVLIYQSEKKVVQYDLQSESVINELSVAENFNKFIQKDNLLVGISCSGYKFFDGQLLGVKSVPVKSGIGNFNLYADNFIVVATDYDYSLFQAKVGIQDVYRDKLLWESNFGELIEIELNKAFTVSRKGVSRRDLKTGEVKWSVDLASDKHLPRLIGASSEIVIFAFKAANKVIAFDLETGSIEWKIDTFSGGLRVDEDKGTLHQMLTSYAAFDLLSGKLKDNYQDKSYFESVCIHSQRDGYILDGNHIITTDRRLGAIGAFNIVSHKFDWLYKEDGVSFPGATSMIFREPYLLVYDHRESLHIFKRT